MRLSYCSFRQLYIAIQCSRNDHACRDVYLEANSGSAKIPWYIPPPILPLSVSTFPCGQGDARAFTKLAEPVQGTVFHGDGREEALLKHLQSLPELSADQTSSLSLYDRSQRVLDAIHEFGKAENRYLMSVGETKGRQVEEVLRERKAKVSCHFHFNAGAGRSYCRLDIVTDGNVWCGGRRRCIG